MGIQISYMGTKRHMAGLVLNLTRSLPDGPLLDAFSGMCAVGERLASTRPLWTNDFLVFPALVAKCLFTTDTPCPTLDRAKKVLVPPLSRNMRALEARLAEYVAVEDRFLERRSFDLALESTTRVPYVGTHRRLEAERQRLAKAPTTFPYRLAAITYAGSYFGVRQSIEIDSIRYAIDYAASVGSISAVEKDWLLIVLGQVASRVNNSTGHFAEYLKPKRTNLQRIIQKRRRSVLKEFFETLDSVSPVGSQKWRMQNLAFCSDALELLQKIRNSRIRPAVIYADPPYSKAQYSRYYHVLDVLLEYRYPSVSGEGRYSDRRPRTVFALESQVVDSIQRLVAFSARLGASLILSYPSSGLLAARGVEPLQIMREHYPHAELAISVKRQHSTFGAAAAAWRIPARENIYIGLL